MAGSVNDHRPSPAGPPHHLDVQEEGPRGLGLFGRILKEDGPKDVERAHGLPIDLHGPIAGQAEPGQGLEEQHVPGPPRPAHGHEAEAVPQ
jgi:hypothetical protein